MREWTENDDKLLKILSPEDGVAYHNAVINGASEVWWLSFKKKMFLKGLRLIHDLMPKLGVTQTEEMTEAETECVARFDAKLKELEAKS